MAQMSNCVHIDNVIYVKYFMFTDYVDIPLGELCSKMVRDPALA